MKKATAVFLIMISVFMTSCGKIEIIELNERLIIEAIGIDFEDGKYKVTIEGLDSFTSGSEGNNISSARLTKCYLFEGETIGMAMNSISEITGQTPLFSQARVLILGIDTAREHLSEALDFFRREYTTRTDILIAVSEGSASEIVSADFGENVSAGNIFEASLSSYRHTGKSTYTPLYRFLNSIMGGTDSAYCPIIGIKDNAFSDKKEVDLKGTAIFSKNENVHIITKDDTLAVMIMNNDAENGDITVNTAKGICTFEIIESKAKTGIEIKDGKAVFDVKISIRCDIPEYQTEDLSGLSKDDTEKAAIQAAKQIAALITDVLDETFYKNNCDIFDIGRKINLKNNSFYKNNIIQAETISENVIFNIKVSVSVRRIGKVILEKDE